MDAPGSGVTAQAVQVGGPSVGGRPLNPQGSVGMPSGPRCSCSSALRSWKTEMTTGLPVGTASETVRVDGGTVTPCNTPPSRRKVLGSA